MRNAPPPEPSVPPVDTLRIKEEVFIRDEDGLVADADRFNEALTLVSKNALQMYAALEDSITIEDGVLLYGIDPDEMAHMLRYEIYSALAVFEDGYDALERSHTYKAGEFLQALQQVRACLGILANHSAAYKHAKQEGFDYLDINGYTMALSDYPDYMERISRHIKENAATMLSYCEVTE